MQTVGQGGVQRQGAVCQADYDDGVGHDHNHHDGNANHCGHWSVMMLRSEGGVIHECFCGLAKSLLYGSLGNRSVDCVPTLIPLKIAYLLVCLLKRASPLAQLLYWAFIYKKY